MTKISALTPIGDSLAINDQFIIRDFDDAGTPNKSVTVSGITRALQDGTAAIPALAFANDKNTGIFRPGDDQLAISTNGTEKLIVKSDGKVGIGNSSPGANLQVVRTTGDNLDIVRIGQSDNYYLGISRSTTTGAFSFQGNQTGNNNILLAPSSGRVGIGTTGPSGRLDVETASDTYINFSTSNNGSAAGICILGNNNDEFFGYANSLRFATITGKNAAGFNERMRMDSFGRLLVGTSSAFDTSYIGTNYQIGIEKLNTYAGFAMKANFNNADGCYILMAKSRGSSLNTKTVVNNDDNVGAIVFEGADGTNMLRAAQITCFIDGTPGADDMPGRLVFSTTAASGSSPTEALRIDSFQQLKTVPTYNNTSALASNVGVASTGVLYRSTSSAKYKTDIETIEDSYSDALLNCRPVWYRSTCKSDCSEHGFWGFIAEEVAEIDPRLVHWKTTKVTYDKKGSAVEAPCEPEPEGVAYERFVPHLLNLIKRQGEAIADLQVEMAALKAQ